MTIDTDRIAALAGRLRQAAQTRTPIAPIREELTEGGVAAAYAVQAANVAHGLAHGRRLVGRKIGLTSKAVQQQLGVDSPDFGALFADMEVADGEEVVSASLLQPRVEAEITLVVGRDLTQARMGLADLVSGLAYALPSIEIVGSRIADWKIGLLDTIADNASSGLFVLGATPVKIEAVDWRLAGMVMERRGEPVSTGAGAACLGNPLNAALWLARTMAALGEPLRAGDLVMTGALGPMVAVAPGDVVEARIAGLGSVRAAFGA